MRIITSTTCFTRPLNDTFHLEWETKLQDRNNKIKSNQMLITWRMIYFLTPSPSQSKAFISVYTSSFLSSMYLHPLPLLEHIKQNSLQALQTNYNLNILTWSLSYFLVCLWLLTVCLIGTIIVIHWAEVREFTLNVCVKILQLIKPVSQLNFGFRYIHMVSCKGDYNFVFTHIWFVTVR